MIDFSDKTFVVVDNGLFIHVAQKLAESGAQVLYKRTWEDAFPRFSHLFPGTGLSDIRRITHYEDWIGKGVCWVFPDLFFGPLQEYLREQGERVWGSGMGEELEIYRYEFKQVLKKLKLPIGPFKHIIGMDDLREYLKDNDDQYVKTSVVRGDVETFFSKTYELSEPLLDKIEYSIGPAKHVIEFICEDSQSETIEIGYDGFCIDGRFAQSAGIQGFEVKDQCYLGIIRPYDKLCEQVKVTNDALSNVLNAYGYRGFYSTEIGVDKVGKPFFRDPACRIGSPPGEVYLNAYSNWPEIIWQGAKGHVVEPEIENGTVLLEVMVDGEFAEHTWQPVYFPESISRHYKFRNLCQIDGTFYVAPQGVNMAVGSVVATGKTFEQAWSDLKTAANELEGCGLKVHLESMPQTLALAEKCSEHEIAFTDQPLPKSKDIDTE